MLIWIITAIALIGTWLNAKQKRVGFIFWIASNTGLSTWNFLNEDYAQGFLFLCYWGLAIYGYFSWKKVPV